jgi:hypothetical protein
MFWNFEGSSAREIALFVLPSQPTCIHVAVIARENYNCEIRDKGYERYELEQLESSTAGHDAIAGFCERDNESR